MINRSSTSKIHTTESANIFSVIFNYKTLSLSIFPYDQNYINQSLEPMLLDHPNHSIKHPPVAFEYKSFGSYANSHTHYDHIDIYVGY